MDWEEFGMQERKCQDDFECPRHCRFAFDEIMYLSVECGEGALALFCAIRCGACCMLVHMVVQVQYQLGFIASQSRHTP